MPLVIFLKAASGPNFGPYQVGDRAILTNQTITDLADAVTVDVAPGEVPNQPAGIE